MLPVRTISALLLLTSCVPGCLGNAFNNFPVVVKGDVTGTAALEWTMQSQPGRDDVVSFTFNGDGVFRYIPYTGVIPPRVLDESVLENAMKVETSYAPRFAIYNTSTRGVGFRLAGLRREDAGTYTCRYESLTASLSTDAVLFVYGAPNKPVIEVSPQIFIEGVKTVSLECGASTTSLPVAYRPVMLYTWRRNGVVIDRTGPPERHTVLGVSGQTLEISPVRHTDTTYTCTASEYGTQLTSEETEVLVNVPPFVKFPGLVTGDVTRSAALEWTLDSEPGDFSRVIFLLNYTVVLRYIHYTEWNVLNGSDPRFSPYNTSTRGVGFQLSGLRPEDAGTYMCRYEPLLEPVSDASAVLFVYDVPGRPVIEVNPQILIDEVSSVTLKCEAFSTSHPAAHRPAMLYTWSRNGVDIDKTGSPERHDVLDDSGQTLEVSPVHHTDITYACRASENGTRLASEDTVVTLAVLHGPKKLIINPLRPSARVKEDLEITASADCIPTCNYTWSIAGRFIRQGSLLILSNFQSCDANNYTVQVDNAYGTADLTVEVTFDVSPEKHETPDDVIILLLATVACVSLTITVVVVSVAARRGLFSCPKDSLSGGGLSTRNQFIANGADYDDVAPRTMERALHTDIVGGLRGIQTTPAGHQLSGDSGVYESIDETGQPVQPAHQVYLTLRE